MNSTADFVHEFLENAHPITVWDKLLGEDASQMLGSDHAESFATIESYLRDLGARTDGLDGSDFVEILPEGSMFSFSEEMLEAALKQLCAAYILKEKAKSSKMDSLIDEEFFYNAGAENEITVSPDTDILDLLEDIYNIPRSLLDASYLSFLKLPCSIVVHDCEMPRCAVSFTNHERMREEFSGVLSDLILSVQKDGLTKDALSLFRQATGGLVELNDDDLERIKAIADFCTTRVDNDGADFADVFKSAPYKATLIDNLIQAGMKAIEDIMGMHGFMTEDEASISTCETSSLRPPLLALLGNETVGIPSICRTVFVDRLIIGLPEIEDRGSHITLVPTQMMETEIDNSVEEPNFDDEYIGEMM